MWCWACPTTMGGLRMLTILGRSTLRFHSVSVHLVDMYSVLATISILAIIPWRVVGKWKGRTYTCRLERAARHWTLRIICNYCFSYWYCARVYPRHPAATRPPSSGREVVNYSCSRCRWASSQSWICISLLWSREGAWWAKADWHWSLICCTACSSLKDNVRDVGEYGGCCEYPQTPAVKKLVI